MCPAVISGTRAADGYQFAVFHLKKGPLRPFAPSSFGRFDVDAGTGDGKR